MKNKEETIKEIKQKLLPKGGCGCSLCVSHNLLEHFNKPEVYISVLIGKWFANKWMQRYVLNDIEKMSMEEIKENFRYAEMDINDSLEWEDCLMDEAYNQYKDKLSDEFIAFYELVQKEMKSYKY